MVGMRQLALAALVVGLSSTGGRAGEPKKDCPIDNSPCPTYSCTRYWAPGLAHCCDNCHGIKIPVWPPNRHPEIPPTVTIIRYPCMAAYPAATILIPPTPPAESKFRY
jgi:hypothetical protein